MIEITLLKLCLYYLYILIFTSIVAFALIVILIIIWYSIK